MTEGFWAGKYWLGMACIAGTLLVLAVLATFLLARYWRSPSMLRNVAINAVLLFFTFAATLWVLEAAFRVFVIYPDGFNVSLASRQWFEKYWHPINSMGVRGPEPDLEAFAAGDSLLFLGDSFTAGSGLEQYQQGFPEQVEAIVRDRWVVAKLAHGGWSTETELQKLKEFPVQPDVVVQQYYLNDINHVSGPPAIIREIVNPERGPALRWMVENSYLFNFVYLIGYRFLANSQEGSFWEYLKGQYADEAVWQQHRAMIEQLIQHCKDNGIDLRAVVIPNLQAVDESAEITARVASVYADHAVPVLNLSDRFEGRSPRELMLNPVNAHPNVATHREIAEAIVEAFDL